MDFNDAATWYFLGNAYFSNFVANFKKFDELEHAIKAYNKAVLSTSFRKNFSGINTPISTSIEPMWKLILKITNQPPRTIWQLTKSIRIPVAFSMLR